MEKNMARKQGLSGRRSISDDERKRRNHEIFLKLLPLLENADKIGCYVSMNDEVSTDEIILWCFENDKKVYVPKVNGRTLQFYEIQSENDLEEGSFHIMEPVTDKTAAVSDLDLIIVPVVAFDEEGDRCGFGKGYYDSILKECNYKIGIAYKEQKVNHIICEEHDVKLDGMIVG